MHHKTAHQRHVKSHSYANCVDKFGEKHTAHPSDWDSPGPVELWFFELPMGHKIMPEYHLSLDQCNIYLDLLEINAVLDYLQSVRMIYLMD